MYILVIRIMSGSYSTLHAHCQFIWLLVRVGSTIGLHVHALVGCSLANGGQSGL